MNLNPSDGHIMDYLTGWEEGNDIGNYEEALAKDYINNTVWNMPVTHIAIVRHQKVFKESFYLIFLEKFSVSLTCHQTYTASARFSSHFTLSLLPLPLRHPFPLFIKSLTLLLSNIICR